MQWQTNPYVLPLGIAGFISLVNALIVAQRRSVPGSLPLLGMLLALSGWSFTYTFELASAQQVWQLFWAKVEYIGIVCVPTLYLLFTLEYARHREILERRRIYWIWSISIAVLILVWTNDSHGLIWSRVGQKDNGGYSLLSLDHGIAFWIWTAYSYGCLLTGSVILIRRAFASPLELKPQSYVLVFGAAITFIGNAIYLSGLTPVPDLDITPITLIISMLAYSIGLFRFGILDIMPIAGETVLESLDDVVIVLDHAGMITYINQAFEYYTKVESGAFIGKHASILPFWSALSTLIDSTSTVRGEVVMNFENGEPVYFQAHVSTVRWKSQRLGRACILEDVTERRRAERAAFGDSREETDLERGSIPLIFVMRAHDEKIIEVNRSFVLALGYERKDIVGQSPHQVGLWSVFERVEFLKFFRGSNTGSLKNHPLALKRFNGQQEKFHVSATNMEIEGSSYIVVFAIPAAEMENMVAGN